MIPAPNISYAPSVKFFNEAMDMISTALAINHAALNFSFERMYIVQLRSEETTLNDSNHGYE